MLSNTCKYAIRSVVYLSVFVKDNKKIGIKEIAKALELPSPFLGKILQNLVRHGILISTKGPNGGFMLKRAPQDISLMDIIEVIDGHEMFDTCLVRDAHCGDEEPCAIHDKVTLIREELKQMFINQTIDDLATEFRRDSKRIRI